MDNLIAIKASLKNKIYLGIVEDNIDPRRLGRIKVRVQCLFDGNEIATEDLPWAFPYKDLVGKTFSVPAVGKIVNVVFDNGSIYSPEYICAEHYNINLENKLGSLSDDEYKNFIALLFDHRTQVYSDDTELRLDYMYNNIKIKKDGINIHLKDNDQELHLGHDYGDQSAILGDHWMEWFDEFMNTLLNPASMLGNMGAPILKPQIDQVILKYQKLRKTFLSKHVKIVDNGACKITDKNRETTPTSDDLFDISDEFGNEKFLNSKSIPNNVKESVKDNRNKDATKTEELKPNPVDEIIDDGNYYDSLQDDPGIEDDPRVENFELSSDESLLLDNNNTIEERKMENSLGIQQNVDVPDSEDPYSDYWVSYSNPDVEGPDEEIEESPEYGSYTESTDKPSKSSSKKKSNDWIPKERKYKGKIIKNGLLEGSDLVKIFNYYFRDDAADSFNRMNEKYKKEHGGKSIPLGSHYRDFDGQVYQRNKWAAKGKPGNAAKPGTSNHGWGLAIDIKLNKSNWENEPLYKWLSSNQQFGWFHPNWATKKAKDDGGNESWHWEYDPNKDTNKKA